MLRRALVPPCLRVARAEALVRTRPSRRSSGLQARGVSSHLRAGGEVAAAPLAQFSGLVAAIAGRRLRSSYGPSAPHRPRTRVGDFPPSRRRRRHPCLACDRAGPRDRSPGCPSDDQHKRWRMSANTCSAGWMQKNRFDYRWAHPLSHCDAYLARLNQRPAQRGPRGRRRLPIGPAPEPRCDASCSWRVSGLGRRMSRRLHRCDRGTQRGRAWRARVRFGGPLSGFGVWPIQAFASSPRR